jgi:benzoyl-CoA 2,3-dioxygenase component B
VLLAEEFERHTAEWLPTPEDRERVAALMQPVYTPGEFASWIAPPAQGVNALPVEFDYVRFD